MDKAARLTSIRCAGSAVDALHNPDIREFVTRLMRNQVYTRIQQGARSRAVEA